jgi:hypothetical protein
MRLFKVLGILLVAALLGYIAIGILAPLGQHPAPGVLGMGSAFTGNLQLKAETIKGVFDAARQTMFAVNGTGEHLRFAGDAAGWLSFAATACITLIVGFFGRAPSVENTPANTEGLPARSIRTIGFLAAFAAVLTAAASMSIAKSQYYFKHADEIRDLIVHARQQVIDAKTPADAQAVLDDLRLQIAR